MKVDLDDPRIQKARERTEAAWRALQKSHSEECVCSLCTAARALLEKHSEGCVCDLCSAARALQEKHSAGCACNLCTAARALLSVFGVLGKLSDETPAIRDKKKTVKRRTKRKTGA